LIGKIKTRTKWGFDKQKEKDCQVDTRYCNREDERKKRFGKRLAKTKHLQREPQQKSQEETEKRPEGGGIKSSEGVRERPDNKSSAKKGAAGNGAQKGGW